MASGSVWLPAAAVPCSTRAAPRAASAWQSESHGAGGLRRGRFGLAPPDGSIDRHPANRELNTYARNRRIVKTDDFSSVFRLRPALRTAHFVLYARPNGLAHARLGVVAAKRMAPRAVTRNTIKRVTRELFRQAELPSIDCIVRLTKPVNAKSGPATSAALKAQLRSELSRLFASQRRPGAHSETHS